MHTCDKYKWNTHICNTHKWYNQKCNKHKCNTHKNVTITTDRQIADDELTHWESDKSSERAPVFTWLGRRGSQASRCDRAETVSCWWCYTCSWPIAASQDSAYKCLSLSWKGYRSPGSPANRLQRSWHWQLEGHPGSRGRFLGLRQSYHRDLPPGEDIKD